MSEEIHALIQGYQRFQEKAFGEDRADFEELVRWGQRPKILIIACSDSRVDPALVLDCKPGDLFVIRNVANLVPPFEDDQSYHGTSAALQFGVCNLEIRHVILFGHTHCGGIQTLLEQTPETCEKKGFIAKWMDIATPAYDAILKNHKEDPLDEKVTLCGHYSLMNSLKNLETFPWVEERLRKKTLSLHAWNFDLERGKIDAFDPKDKTFKELGTA